MLPIGVQHRSLDMHRDDRGCFTEVFRACWNTGMEPLQWNLVSSQANVLRGVHVHLVHDDYLTLVSGRAVIGLRDLRPGSETEGLATLVEMSGDEMSALTIPVGVAHGFCFLEPSVHAYAVSHYFSPADEFGCRWDDPALGITWPVEDPRVSPRDREAPSLEELLATLAMRRRMRPTGGPDHRDDRGLSLNASISHDTREFHDE